MQTLTAQFPTLITRKYKVFYTDFNGVATSTTYIILHLQNKRLQVFHVQIKHTVAFAGAGVTAAILSVSDQQSYTGVYGVPTLMLQHNSFVAVSDVAGSNRAIIARSGAGSVPRFSPYDTAWNLCCGLQINTGVPLNVLTQGEAFLWVTLARFP